MVYAKTPSGGPAQVLEYLGRCSHHTAIGNERIRRVTPDDVIITVRAHEHGGKRRLQLATQEFIRRVLLHGCPEALSASATCVVLANGCKKVQLAQARQALQQPAPNPQALESAQPSIARAWESLHNSPSFLPHLPSPSNF